MTFIFLCIDICSWMMGLFIMGFLELQSTITKSLILSTLVQVGSMLVKFSSRFITDIIAEIIIYYYNKLSKFYFFDLQGVATLSKEKVPSLLSCQSIVSPVSQPIFFISFLGNSI
jgi:hypothetical protein